MTPVHITVVNFTRMGDLVQSGPLMRSLKAGRECRLTLIVYEKFRDVAERLPMVDSVIGFDVDRFVPRLDQNRGDLPAAYDQLTEFLCNQRLLHIDELYNLSHTPQSAALCALMLPGILYGMGRQPDGQLTVNGEWFNYLLSLMEDRTQNPFNLVEIYLRFNPRGGFSAGLELNVTEMDSRKAEELLKSVEVDVCFPYVVLQPGASSPSRMWPAQSFAELAVRLASENIYSVVVGSSEERDLAARIVSMSSGSAVSLAGLTDIGTLASILKSSYKLISNDTGTIHVAAAVETPIVGIYLGPAAAKDTAPFGDGHIIIEPDLNCAPCGYRSECRTWICQNKINVDTVFDLVMAGENERKIAAVRSHGVRILRTKLTPTGCLKLELMNRPETGPNDSYSSYFTWFWDSLLETPRQNRDSIRESAINVSREWRDAIAHLNSIFDHAERSVNALVMDAANGASANRLSASLKKQVEWQNELRNFIKAYPVLSSFPRYLLVRLTTVCTSELMEYLEDLTHTLRFFHRGLSLLKHSNGCKFIEKPADAAVA